MITGDKNTMETKAKPRKSNSKNHGQPSIVLKPGQLYL